MIARTTTGRQLAALIPVGSTLWVPDGLFDVEVHAVLRRWDMDRISPLQTSRPAECVLRLFDYGEPSQPINDSSTLRPCRSWHDRYPSVRCHYCNTLISCVSIDPRPSTA